MSAEREISEAEMQRIERDASDRGGSMSGNRDRPGGSEPTYAEHPGYGIWPCENVWHTTMKPYAQPIGECPDCPNRWWASDGSECPEEYALLAEIDWVRAAR